MDRDGEQEHNNSMDIIQASEAYPKKDLVTEDSSIPISFPTIPGEAVEYLGRTTEGTLALSNFRVFATLPDGFCNIPLGLIEQVECRDIFYLHIHCKDAKSLRCTFSTNDLTMEWYKRLVAATTPTKKLDDMFACAFYTWCKEEDNQGLHRALADSKYDKTSFDNELERLKFTESVWRVSLLNKDYKFCSSYPEKLIVPQSVKDEDLESVGSFRAYKRIPAVVWRHPWNGTVIARCSQPEVGILGWRRAQDENLVNAIARSCGLEESLLHKGDSKHLPNGDLSKPKDKEASDNNEKNTTPSKRLLILDARSYAAAMVNRAKGGGSEFPEYYSNCEIQFMNLANIHSIRKSFHSVRTLCNTAVDQANWFSLLESTKWLHHLSALLKGALVIVHTIETDRRPVLVHCSDGWDRTPQLVALAELMLDPFYREMKGFQVLVEREWLQFGHKFADRNGHCVSNEDVNERSPVFLQWLDCVHQLLVQFPCYFEFNEAYLIKLAQHVYSCLFGTFLFNCDKERKEKHVYDRTYSIWSYFCSNQHHYKNQLFIPKNKVLRPAHHVRDLHFWTSIYVPSVVNTEEAAATVNGKSTSKILEGFTVPGNAPSPPNCATVGGHLSKTRSCENLFIDLSDLTTSHHSLVRRSSDPSLLEGCISDDSDFNEDKRQEVGNGLRFDLNGDSADEGSEDSPDITITSECGSARKLIMNGTCNGVELNITTPTCEEEKCGEDKCDVDGCVPETEVAEECVEQMQPITTAVATMCLNGKRETSAIETSTDTLVGLGEMPVNREVSEPEVTPPVENGIYESESNGGVPNFNRSVSTSTSDISDSIFSLEQHLHKLRYLSQLETLRPKDFNNTCSKWLGMDVSSSTESVLVVPEETTDFVADKPCCLPTCGTPSTNSTPMHSRTPSSGLGTTPSEDPFPSITNRLGTDGLTIHKDDIQHRVRHIYQEEEYKRLVETSQLKKQLRQILCAHKNLCHQCALLPQVNPDSHDDSKQAFNRQWFQGSLPDSISNRDPKASGPESLTPSDTSWEHLDDGDGAVTLWVPDHAASRCMGCNSQFWLINPRHHCSCFK